MPITHVQFGDGVLVTQPDLISSNRCRINDGTTSGPFVEIEKNSAIGVWRKISSRFFICEGVMIEHDGFISRSVMSINEFLLRATTVMGGLHTEAGRTVVPTRIRRGASIEPNAATACGMTVGRPALVSGRATVPDDIPTTTAMIANPARPYDRTEPFGSTEPSPIRAVA